MALLPHRDGVVEVLCRLGVDRETELVSKVDAVARAGIGIAVGLEVGPSAGVNKQSLEDDPDVVRLAQHALYARAAAPNADDGEVAGSNISGAAAVDSHAGARDEVRLAEEQLAALVDLDDLKVVQIRRKRRIVSPDPAAPRSSPVMSRISAFSENESAFTSSPALSGPV